MTLDHLRRAVEAMHECKATHERTARVHEVFEHRTVWNGDVQIFSLEDHPKARRAFAWSFEENGETQYVAVLEIPPVTSPRTAVQAAIASGQAK